MKKLGLFVLIVMMVALVGCASWDTFRYMNGADSGHVVEAAPCSVDAPALPAAKVVNIKEAILFDFDKSNIRKSEEATLDKISGLLKSNPETAIVLDGYTCKIGTDQYNKALAERRATSVKTALVARGISADRISKITNVGETDLFGKVKKENRRVMVLSVE